MEAVYRSFTFCNNTTSRHLVARSWSTSLCSLVSSTKGFRRSWIQSPETRSNLQPSVTGTPGVILRIVRFQMRFNPDLLELIPPSHLDSDFGGEFSYEFEPKSYWDQIVAQATLFWLCHITLSVLPFSACGIAPDGTRVQTSDIKEEDTAVVQDSDVEYESEKGKSLVFCCPAIYSSSFFFVAMTPSTTKPAGMASPYPNSKRNSVTYLSKRAHNLYHKLSHDAFGNIYVLNMFISKGLGSLGFSRRDIRGCYQKMSPQLYFFKTRVVYLCIFGRDGNQYE